jgi:hypothetical protein
MAAATMAAVPEVAVVVATATTTTVAHAHAQHLGRLDHPCPLQAPVKDPSAPRPGDVLRALVDRAPLRHPQGMPLL